MTAATGGERPTRVLVVDDSAFVRKVVREVLTSAGLDVVDIARDGVDALEKLTLLRPDVVTLDLHMPNLDGLGVLQAAPAGPDAPRFVIVSTADEDSPLAVAALCAGAVELVRKPVARANDKMYEMAGALVAAVRSAARARVLERLSVAPPEPRPAPSPAPTARDTQLVVIGTSTGGPQALTRLLAEFPADFPVPVAIAVHMPAGYTAALAERLDRGSRLTVVEAEDGTRLAPGIAVIARAGVHLKIDRDDAGLCCRLDVRPVDTLHRPSVDVLFESAARAAGRGALAVVLTGMGDDGTLGARAVKEAGGVVLAEAESSCVVYGMPRSVVDAGLATATVPLGEAMAEILRRL